MTKKYYLKQQKVVKTKSAERQLTNIINVAQLS